MSFFGKLRHTGGELIENSEFTGEGVTGRVI